MKNILILVLLTTALTQAAELVITVKRDDGTTVSTTTITTTNAVLAAVNDWRLEKILTPAIAERVEGGVTIPAVPAVLQYPTPASLWRGVVGGFVRSIVGDRLAAIQAEQAKIEAARTEIERLRGPATQ